MGRRDGIFRLARHQGEEECSLRQLREYNGFDERAAVRVRVGVSDEREGVSLGGAVDSPGGFSIGDGGSRDGGYGMVSSREGTLASGDRRIFDSLRMEFDDGECVRRCSDDMLAVLRRSVDESEVLLRGVGVGDGDRRRSEEGQSGGGG